ncbi:MAG TPA: ABC transporter ATP-binding protein [bacterium]|nr:ABC transporter ATP-binding protein [bacterium]
MSGERTALLRAVGLSKAFGGLRAVIDVSFDVARGEIVGLLGPNGSGKTTVLNLVAGALRPDAGRVFLDRSDITRLPASARTRLGVARTFQLVRPLPSLTALDNVVVARLYARDRPSLARARAESARLLDLVGLAGREAAPAGALTLTDRKRVEIARALAAQPQVVLLDEPLGGLNPTETAAMLALFRRLRGQGATLLLVEHNVGAVRALCDRVIILNSGRRIAEGPPAEALTRPEVVAIYLGARSGAAELPA